MKTRASTAREQQQRLQRLCSRIDAVIVASGAVSPADDYSSMSIELVSESVVNLKTMSQLAECFGTDDISLTPHTPGRVWSELTMDPSQPEKLILLGVKYGTE